MRVLYLCVALIATLPAWAADDKSAYDRIDFSVSAKSEVDNDTLTAVLYAHRQGPELAVLANEVNKAIAAAVKRAKQEPAVSVRTLDYQTYPNYQDNRIDGWQVKQSIRLESKTPEALTKLMGELQASLAVESVGYGISPEKLKEQQERLIGQALAEFRGRAERITKDLGRSQYRLVQAAIDTGGEVGPRPRMMAMARAEMAIAAPTLEAGKDTVEVRVQGTIELQPR